MDTPEIPDDNGSLLYRERIEREEIEEDWRRIWNNRMILRLDTILFDRWITEDEYAYYIEWYRFLRDADRHGLGVALPRSQRRVKRRLETLGPSTD